MRRLLKILGWIAAGLIGLIVVAVVGVALLVDPNDYRDDINRIVEQQTGRELRLGEISLSVFPWLGAELSDVVLGSAAGFDETPFLTAKEAQVRIRLLPLLRGEARLGTVVLDGVRLHLVRKEDGTTSWDDLIAAPETPAPDRQPKQDGGLAALAVGGVAIEDARLVWKDRMLDREATISDMALEVGRIAPGEVIPISGSFGYDLSDPALAGRVGLHARVVVQPEPMVLSVREATLETTATGEALPGAPVETTLEVEDADLTAEAVSVSSLRLAAAGVSLTGRLRTADLGGELSGQASLQGTITNADTLRASAGEYWPAALTATPLDGGRITTDLSLDLGSRTATVDTLSLSMAGLQAQVEGSAEDILAAPRARAEFALELEAPRETFALLDANVGGFQPDALEGATLSGSAGLDWSDRTAAVDRLTLSVGGAEAVLNASARDLGTSPVVTGRLASNTFSPRALARRIGIELPEGIEEGALGRAEIAADFSATPQSGSISELRVQVDDTTLTGALQADRFAPPAVGFQLAVDRLNLDRYLAAAEEPQAASPGSAAAGAAQLPQEMLRELDVEGSVEVGELQAFDLKARQIFLQLQGREGKFRLHPARAELYEGEYSGDSRLDVTGERPRISLNESLAGIQAGPLLQDLLGKAYLSGAADIQAELIALGVDPDAMVRSLSGKGRFKFSNGAVKGFNIAQLIREASAVLEGRAKPEEETKATDFAELQGTLTVKDGTVFNDDLAAQSPLFRVVGEGKANLVEQTLDYRLGVAVVESLEGQGGQRLSELKGLTVPLQIGGSFTSPDIDVALETALKAKAEQALKKEKQKLEQKLKQRLERELDGKAQEGEPAKSDETLKDTEEKAKKELKKKLDEGLKDLFER